MAEQVPGVMARRFYAYYRPSPFELELLNAGGFIEIAQYGNFVQPFSCSIWAADHDDMARNQGGAE
jgi:hypothetical protein